MLKPFKSILFATDLSEECKSAFDFTVALATKLQATIVLLHVLEKVPDYVEGRLRGFMGEELWSKTMSSHAQEAHMALIGKRSSSAVIKAALQHYCDDAGISDEMCDYKSRKVIISNGNIVDEIVKQAEDHNCGLIILSSKKGMMTKSSVSSTTKGVLRSSTIPVVVVPKDNLPSKTGSA